MKPTLLFTTLSMFLATPSTFANSELETLRSRCSEQERQIRQLEEENSKLRSGGREIQSSVTKATAASTPAASAPPSTYVVKAGDNLEKIARNVGMNPQKFAKSNGLTLNSIIHPGQKLKVGGTAVTPSAAPASAAAVASAPSVSKSPGTHKVQQGETFSSISKKHKMSTAALIAANPKVKPTALYPGQVISLGRVATAARAVATTTDEPVVQLKSSTPVMRASAAAAQAHAPVATAPAHKQNMPVSTAASAPTRAPAVATAPPETRPAPAIANLSVAEPETLSPAPDKKIHPVTIDGEMTYGDFAAMHGTDAERLNALNGLDLTKATVLAKGSELYVPAQP